MKPKLAAADRPMSGLMMIAGRLNDYYACTNVPDHYQTSTRQQYKRGVFKVGTVASEEVFLLDGPG